MLVETVDSRPEWVLIAFLTIIMWVSLLSRFHIYKDGNIISVEILEKDQVRTWGGGSSQLALQSVWWIMFQTQLMRR